MPKPTKQSVKAFSTERIDSYCIRTWARRQEATLSDIIRSLSKYGLETHEIKLVYYRAVKDMGFRDLVKKQGWISIQSASYHYRLALSKLRVAGFKLR